MTTTKRVKFSSQADPELLTAMRDIAAADGRQFQAVLEDAMRSYLEQRTSSGPRPHMMAHFEASVARHRRLGELLAK